MVKKKIEVVAAIIVNNDKILCAQRGDSKLDYISNKWEFPGGKVEKGEGLEQAILREIKEELLLKVDVERLFITVEHSYPDFDLTMHAFLCNSKTFDVELTEHKQTKWLEVNDLNQLDWAAADLPIVDKLVNNGK